MLEEPHTDQEADCRALLAVLGIPAAEGARLDIGMTLYQSAYDRENPSAIAGAVLAARRGARSVREVISSEMWECLNVTSHGLASRRKSADRLGPHVYLEFIRERSALFFGLTESTMSHDEAWRFLVLGRSLERVDMTARLLLARMLAMPYEVSWPMLLRSCGATSPSSAPGPGPATHSRSWGSGDERLFPRSVVHALATAEEALGCSIPRRERRADRPGAAVGRRAVDRAGIRGSAAAPGPAAGPAGHAAAHLPGGQRGHHCPLLHYEQPLIWAQECYRWAGCWRSSMRRGCTTRAQPGV